jgi:NAD(P)-dependent dehydrogenase (short-subunit alcohol dehydrogenase family)
MELRKKLAIVTGGSRGIGRGISRVLAKAGADLAVVYRKNSEAFENLKSSLESSGVQIRGYQLDVTNFDNVRETFAEIFNHFGSIDILVNCAGRAPSTRSVFKGEVKEWHAIINLDLHGAYYCCKAVLDYMHEQQSGHIVNISSVVASTCHAGSASYAVAKAGLEALTKVLAREEAQHGIQVNAISPGLIESDMSNAMKRVYGEDRMKEVFESIPLGRFGSPRDVGNLVAYVVSSKGVYITGQVLGVDGGMYYWKSTFADL